MLGKNLRMTTQDDGFTLIELMIVVLIVAILIAVAIPTFLGQRKGAEDAAAKSNLRNALTTEKAYYAGAEVFTADLDLLSAIEPSLFNVTGLSPAANTFDPVVVSTDGVAGTVCIVAVTPRGDFLAVWEDAKAGATQYGFHTSNPLPSCPSTPPTVGTWSTGGW